MLDDKLQNFRQPIITSSGILLGFVLNIAGEWVRTPSKRNDTYSAISSLCLLACISILVMVLYRTLNINYPRERAEQYYKRTLFYFILGIIIILANFAFIMVRHYLGIA